jgi:hypothetical protein
MVLAPPCKGEHTSNTYHTRDRYVQQAHDQNFQFKTIRRLITSAYLLASFCVPSFAACYGEQYGLNGAPMCPAKVRAGYNKEDGTLPHVRVRVHLAPTYQYLRQCL